MKTSGKGGIQLNVGSVPRCGPRIPHTHEACKIFALDLAGLETMTSRPTLESLLQAGTSLK
jgi:hypothetical protein